MVTEELLGGLATSKSSTELHGRRSRASSTGLVLTSRRLPVCSPVSLWLITTGPGSSSTSRPGVSTRQSALEGGGDNLGGQVEVVPQVLDTLVGEVPVVVTPCELLLHIATRLQAGQGLDHLQVGNGFELRMLGGVEILFGHHHTLLEEVLVDGYAILLGHQHLSELTLLLL